MSFQEDFNKRLRRLNGVTDDTTIVSTYEDTGVSYEGYCETCSYTVGTYEFVVTIYERDEDRYGSMGKVVARSTYGDMGELIRDLDSVEL
jgi:hypothetical protein